MFNSLINNKMTKLKNILLVGALLVATFASAQTADSVVTLLFAGDIMGHDSQMILMVNGSVGTGIAVAGAFSLVRFRSVAGKAKDISAIFLVMTAGLASAAGYVVIALLFTVLVSAVILVLSHLSFGQKDAFELHITVPETLQFAGAFDDLFAKYTNSHRLVKTRTTNMGSLYKLSYDIELKDPTASQAFMDELRCRNGNLEILICEKMEGSDSL